MSNSPVLSSLVNKYAELAGELDEARKQTRRLEHSLAAIADTIRIYEPDYPLSAIKAKKKQTRIPGVKRNDVFKMSLEALKETIKPLCAKEIASIIQDKSIVPLEPEERKRLEESVFTSLCNSEKKGYVKTVPTIGPKHMTQWELALQDKAS
jgi:hypothetical protein